MALCFLTVSALASLDHGHASTSDDVPAVDLSIVSDTPQMPEETDDQGQQLVQTDDCPCKKKSGSLALACGVALALSGETSNDHLLHIKDVWFAGPVLDRKSELLYLLIRPPRQVL